eukprot:SAG11_NODE_1129_length_5761_cov_296.866302_6_plen_126_part_00
MVSSYIQSSTNGDFLNHDRRKYKYDDTYDVQPVFGYVSAIVSSSDFAKQRDLGSASYRKLLRQVVVPLARITLCARSSDLTCIFRGESTDIECIRFSFDAAGTLESVDIRYYRPKQRNGLPVSAK